MYHHRILTLVSALSSFVSPLCICKDTLLPRTNPLDRGYFLEKLFDDVSRHRSRIPRTRFLCETARSQTSFPRSFLRFLNSVLFVLFCSSHWPRLFSSLKRIRTPLVRWLLPLSARRRDVLAASKSRHFEKRLGRWLCSWTPRTDDRFPRRRSKTI